MEYQIKYKFQDDHCVIDVYRCNQYWMTYDFNLIYGFYEGQNFTMLDQIKNKIWGDAEGIGEMWHEVQVQRLIRGL